MLPLLVQNGGTLARRKAHSTDLAPQCKICAARLCWAFQALLPKQVAHLSAHLPQSGHQLLGVAVDAGPHAVDEDLSGLQCQSSQDH